MKNIFIASLFLFVSFSLFAKTKREPIAKIIVLKGKVYKSITKSKGKKRKKLLSKKSKIFKHDKLMTGKKSFLRIKFTDQTIMNIGPKSSLKLSDYKYNGSKKPRVNVIRFLKGKFRTMVKEKAKQEDRIELISSKTVSLGVRGTEILSNVYKVGGKSSLDTVLLSGKGSLKANGKRTEILKGDTFNSNKGIKKIEKLSVKQIEKLQKSDDSFLPKLQNKDGSFKEIEKILEEKLSKKSRKKKKKLKEEALAVQDEDEEEYEDDEDEYEYTGLISVDVEVEDDSDDSEEYEEEE